MKKHNYQIKVEWTGNKGNGTLSYKSYTRDHILGGQGKYKEILGSSDPSFLGDPTKYNPEDLFVASISACHMLWYLNLCSVHNIIVTAYKDNATGTMEETEDGSGKFTQVTLYPTVHVTESSMIAKANQLHEEANKKCFIANSCNFKIEHTPITELA